MSCDHGLDYASLCDYNNNTSSSAHLPYSGFYLVSFVFLGSCPLLCHALLSVPILAPGRFWSVWSNSRSYTTTLDAFENDKKGRLDLDLKRAVE